MDNQEHFDEIQKLFLKAQQAMVVYRQYMNEIRLLLATEPLEINHEIPRKEPTQQELRNFKLDDEAEII